MKKIVAGMTALSVGCLLLGSCASASGVHRNRQKELLIASHRGTPMKFPEHSFAGYDYAIKHGGKYIEQDIILSKDGHLVDSHDNNLKRTLGHMEMIKVAERFKKYDLADYDPQLVTEFFAHNYHDRGLVKWRGFFLSDHTAALKKQQEMKPAALRPAMAQEKVGERLMKAWEKTKHVTIQLNSLNGEMIPEEISGFVRGYDETMLYILQDDSTNLFEVEVESVRNVAFTPEPEECSYVNKWHKFSLTF